MKELRSEIIIHSTATRVWETLIDFERYPQWNPFIHHITGKLEEGARLEVQFQPGGKQGMTFRPIVKLVRSNHELRWLGNLWIPGLFDGEHIFSIDSSDSDQVLFTQREEFKGLFVPLLASRLEVDTKRGFQEMNRALKDLVEREQSE